MSNNSPLHQTQLDLEQEAVDIGIENYNKLLDERGEADTGPATALLKRLIVPLSESVQAFQAKALAGTVGKDISKAKYLKQFRPDVIAYVTAKIALQNCDQEVKVQTVAESLTQILEDTANMDSIKAENPRIYRYLLERIKRSGSTGTHRHFVIASTLKRHELVSIKWSRAEKLSLGMFLLRLLEESSQAILMVKQTLKRGADTPIYLAAY